jgi:hypothetical protein
LPVRAVDIMQLPAVVRRTGLGDAHLRSVGSVSTHQPRPRWWSTSVCTPPGRSPSHAARAPTRPAVARLLTCICGPTPGRSFSRVACVLTRPAIAVLLTDTCAPTPGRSPLHAARVPTRPVSAQILTGTCAPSTRNDAGSRTDCCPNV